MTDSKSMSSISIDDFASLHTELLIKERECELAQALAEAKILNQKGFF